jgi:hypothetical protein
LYPNNLNLNNTLGYAEIPLIPNSGDYLSIFNRKEGARLSLYQGIDQYPTYLKNEQTGYYEFQDV